MTASRQMASNRENFRTQIFWEGSEELSYWYSYVNRSPHVTGHIMLANDEENFEVHGVPKGFETALTVNIEILLKWANEHKGGKCLPVFYRMNIAGDQFRVHILPVSPKEVQDASCSLVKRIPELGRDDKGGFLYFLGGKEHLADKRELDFRKCGENVEAMMRLMEALGIPTIVEQLRGIVAKSGGHPNNPLEPTA